MNSRERLHDLLAGFSHAMLVTRNLGGMLRARPMALAEIDEGGSVWFATSRDSAKVEEVEADAEVCVAFQDSGRYISLTGTARLVDDRAKLAGVWQESWRVWYPQGPGDPNLVLLAVDAHIGEYWDNRGFNGLKYMLRAGKALLTGTQIKIDPNQHHKVVL